MSKPYAKIVVTHRHCKKDAVAGEFVIRLVTDVSSLKLGSFSYGRPYVHEGYIEAERRRAHAFARAWLCSLMRLSPEVAETEEITE